jgi:hypothetical protein
MSINGGRFAVSRDVFDDPFFKQQPYTERQAWIWLQGQAGWKSRRVRATSGRAVQMVDLNRGELCLALRFIQTAWRWSSEKRVRTFLKRLELDARIAVRRDALQNIISICGYDASQFSTVEQDAQTDAQTDAVGTRIRRKLNKDNNSKNDNKSKEDNTLAFDEWYAVYPRKKQPQDARKAYAKVIAAGTITEAILLERTSAFAFSWKRRPAEDQRFIPYPASWLNKAGFADELDTSNRHGIGQPISPEIAARRERLGMQPARPGNVGDALELMIREVEEREYADSAAGARVVGSSSSVVQERREIDFKRSWLDQPLPR